MLLIVKCICLSLRYQEETGMTIVLDAQPTMGMEVENVEYEVTYLGLHYVDVFNFLTCSDLASLPENM